MNMTSWKQVSLVCSICLASALLPCQLAGAENPFSKFLGGLSKSLEKMTSEHPPGAGNEATASTNPSVPAFGNSKGVISKTANIRSGPGTSNPVLVTAPQGTAAILLANQNGWYMVQVNVNGAPTTGWILASLVAVGNASVPSGSAATVSSSQKPGSSIDYAGYSADYRQVREMQVSGNLDGIDKYYTERASATSEDGADETRPAQKEDFLRLLEYGTLSIDQGNYSKAVDGFSGAEALLEERKNDSKIVEGAKKTGGWILGTILGKEELSPYEGEGWERILMLNYKSIALLLQGDRRAYNVTRRAIDWQNIEKKAFDQKLREEKEKLKEEVNKQKAEKEEAQGQNVESGIAAAFAPMDAKASTVPSAYVNPFGFYVAGMIQEFESYDDRSLRDNARISYEKALELNPASKVLKEAVKDMKKTRAPAGTRLVHVVVADGFVPEKKVLTYNVKMDTAVIPLKMPIYEPIKSKVHRIEVRTTSGKRLATLSPVADVEAICLRQQKDLQPIYTMRAMASFFVSAAMDSTAQSTTGIGGAIFRGLSNIRKKTSAPDTRSWMSLPATVQAARLHLGKGIRKLRIDTYAKNGKRLASKTVQIDPNQHNFIYARSIDSVLYVQSTEKLWLAEM